jgi:hypothetical protein
MRMEITLLPDEHIVRESEANHYIEGKLMIGRLFLTNQRLVFRTHLHNFKQYDITVSVHAISRVSYRNHLGIFSHGIWIHETDETIHHFSVWSRRKWKEAIEGMVTAVHGEQADR